MGSPFNKLSFFFAPLFFLGGNNTQAQDAAEYLWRQEYDQYFNQCMASTTTGIEPAMPFSTYGLHSHQQVADKNYCNVYATEKTPSPEALYQVSLDRCVNARLENIPFLAMQFGVTALKPQLVEFCERYILESIVDNQR
jgi:hypothetical protein